MKTKTIHISSVGVLSFETPIANGLAILAGSILIAVLAQISIHVPFSPVPITGQTIGVILVGGLLGRKRGVLAVAAYLFEGASGLPVFAEFKAGAHVLVGPTAGYLWAFIPAAYLSGLAVENGFTANPVMSFITCFGSTTLILILGAGFLSIITESFSEALSIGFYPFLVGDVVKSSLCAVLLSSARKIN